MSAITGYRDDIKEISTILSGNPAPDTGKYYTHIYSQYDPATGVPTLDVQLHNVSTTSTTTDTQEQLGSDVLTITDSNDVMQDGGGLTIGLMFVLGLFIIFIYFIIRIWQDNRAQRRIMTKIPESNSIKEESQDTNIIETEVGSNWRNDIEQADKRLDTLLGQKGIIGDSISDKLKNVSAGQFASIDMAWEAHQSAKKLLTMHESEIQEQDIKRVLQLYKQVFAEHDVI